MARIRLENIQINTRVLWIAGTKAYLQAMLGSKGMKTCNGMGEELNVSHDVLQRILDRGPKTEYEIREFLLDIAKSNATDAQKGYLVCDDTKIIKEFSEILEKLGLVNDKNNYDKHKHYKIVVLVWTNGAITVPIDFKIWIDGITPSKVELAGEMITENYKKIQFEGILMDGLYPSKAILKLLKDIDVKYVIRLPSNRVVSTTKHGPKIKIKDHWEFKLNKNRRMQKVGAYLYDEFQFIISSKQKGRDDEYHTRHLITNIDANPQDILFMYEFRWTIEETFRTIKQKLGLQDCLSRSIDGQKNHIWMTLASYAIAGVIALNTACKNPDTAIRMIRKKNHRSNYTNDSMWKVFSAFA